MAQNNPSGPRLPYAPPRLRTYGTVAAMTATLLKSGVLKDGGPNNTKT